MAHSIQTVRERVEILNDADLLALISLMNEIAEQDRKAVDSLGWFFDGLQETCREYGPGMIDLNLETIAECPAQRAAFEQLLTSVEHRLAEFAESIPATCLATWCKVRGVRFRDYPTSNVETTIERIRALLS